MQFLTGIFFKILSKLINIVFHWFDFGVGIIICGWLFHIPPLPPIRKDPIILPCSEADFSFPTQIVLCPLQALPWVACCTWLLILFEPVPQFKDGCDPGRADL